MIAALYRPREGRAAGPRRQQARLGADHRVRQHRRADHLLHGRAGGGVTAEARRGPAATPAIRARGLTKRFGAVLALDGARPRRAARLDLRPARAQRRRQDDDDPDPHRPRPGDVGGTASVAGVEVGRDRPELRRRIGYLDQDPAVLRLDEGPRAARAVRPADRARAAPELRSRVAEMLERSACADAGERRIGGYSRRDAAAARDRPGRDPPSRQLAVPRRAGELARPRGPAGPARADRRAPRRSDGRSSRPTSSPTSSGSATASRSSIAAGS